MLGLLRLRHPEAISPELVLTQFWRLRAAVAFTLEPLDP